MHSLSFFTQALCAEVIQFYNKLLDVAYVPNTWAESEEELKDSKVRTSD